MANSSPEKVFRIGLINASVFKNTIEPKEGPGPKKTIRSVNLQRRYYDEKEDRWESTTSFQMADLPATIEVLKLALAYVESVEAEVAT